MLPAQQVSPARKEKLTAVGGLFDRSQVASCGSRHADESLPQMATLAPALSFLWGLCWHVKMGKQEENHVHLINHANLHVWVA
jgi:hypothetical protein